MVNTSDRHTVICPATVIQPPLDWSMKVREIKDFHWIYVLDSAKRMGFSAEKSSSSVDNE